MNNVFYGYRIELMPFQSDLNLNTIYERLQVSKQVNDYNTGIVDVNLGSATNNKFIYKSYYSKDYKKTKTGIDTKTCPPVGPIPEYTWCIECQEQENHYHKENCSAIDENLILTIDGLTFYQDRITTLKEEVVENIIQKYGGIPKYMLYMSRKKKLQSEQITASKFPNVVQLKYLTSPIINNDQYNNTSYGMLIPIKISKQLGITIKNIPYNLNETSMNHFPDIVLNKILSDLGVQSKVKDRGITNINCSLILFEGKKIDLEKIDNDIIQDTIQKCLHVNLHKYSTLPGKIIVYFIYSGCKFCLQIFSGGTGQLFMSSSRDDDNDTQSVSTISSTFAGFINVDTFNHAANNLVNFLKSSLKDYVETQDKQVKTKIMNTITPSPTYENGIYKFRILSTPYQPKCAMTIKEINTAIPSNIDRPFPYSFSKGFPPTRQSAINDEGNQNKTKAGLGSIGELYEPCCSGITNEFIPVGKNKAEKAKNNEIYKGFNAYFSNGEIDEDWIKDFSNAVKNTSSSENMEVLKSQFKNICENINKATERNAIRRALFGFPNDIFPEDFANKYNIKNEQVIIPTVTKFKITGKGKNREAIFNEQSIKKVQVSDAGSAVYVPGTQFTVFGGDGTLKRDSRIFRGLFDRSKEDLIKILNLYKEKLIIKEESDYYYLSSDFVERYISQIVDKEHVIRYILVDQNFKIKTIGKNKFIVNDGVDNIDPTSSNPKILKFENLSNAKSLTNDIFENNKVLIIVMNITKDNQTTSRLFVYNKNVYKEIVSKDIILKITGNLNLLYTVSTYNTLSDNGLVDYEHVYITKNIVNKVPSMLNNFFKFSFNYYINVLGNYNLIPNQPFVPKLENDFSLKKVEITPDEYRDKYEAKTVNRMVAMYNNITSPEDLEIVIQKVINYLQ